MGKGSSNKAADQAKWDEVARQNKIRNGTNAINSTFNQFNDDFYNNRGSAYTTYALPQLEDQYTDAQKQLTYALARSGQLESSERGTKEAELQKLYDTHKRDVQDKAQQYSSTARANVEDARSNLVSTLNATGDAEGAASSSIDRANVLSQGDTYSPLTNLFTDFINGIGRQYAAEKSASASGQTYTPLYSAGLNGSNSSVQTTR